MAVEIRKYQPVLDVAIPVAEEFVKEGRAGVVTGTHPDAVGLVVDLQHLLYVFYSHFDTNVTIKIDGIEDSFVFTQPRSDDIEHKLLEVEFNGGLDFNPERNGDLFGSTILEASGDVRFPNKISVSASNNKKSQRDPFGVQLSKHIVRPKQIERITLKFGYMNLVAFPVSTFYQDFSPLGNFEYKDSGQIRTVYPVSGSDSHELDIDAWKFFELPVFWDAWSQWHSHALQIASGEETIESVSRKYGVGVDKVSEHIEKAKTGCYRIIERLVKNGKLDDLLDKLNCPRYLRGYFLNKPLKTLDHILYFNAEESHAQNLVDSYNEEYASKNGAGRITVGGLRKGMENLWRER